MKCCQCDKTAMFRVGPEGQQAPLCLGCYVLWQRAQAERQDMLGRALNFMLAELDAHVGISGITPRYPERTAIIQTGGVTLNNIHVSDSEIGVLNTGTIESVDNTLTVLKTEGNKELAASVTALSEAVIKAAELSNHQKDQILELLGSLSEEAVAPKEKRKLAVVRALIAQLSGILGGIESLRNVWELASSIFQQVFGS